jgi:hypothetical protein
MGDWDLKSHRQVDLETENRTLTILHKRLMARLDDFFGFISSSPELGLKWATFLTDRHVEKELSDLEKNIKKLEDLHLKTFLGETNV